MRALKLSVLLSLFIGAPLASQAPSKLTSADFALSGIPDRADTSIVHRVLGLPDSIADGDDPSHAEPIPGWWYRDLRVVLLAGRELHGWWITGQSRATARGLRVGASRAQVQRLYGRPTNAYADSIMVYCEPHGGTVPRCMYVWLQRNRVQSIYIGRSVD